MGYILNQDRMQVILNELQKDYIIYAPQNKVGEGMYSDTDVVRYERIQQIMDVEFHKKSNYSFKEVLLPISQTLFYYTENEVKEAEVERKKGAIIFLRSCDLHAVKRLDEMYLKNGFEDYYYKRLRDNVKFVVMGCENSFENCFCVSMGSNIPENYDIAIEERDGLYYVDCKDDEINALFEMSDEQKEAVTIHFVQTNDITVSIPENLSIDVIKSKMWDEYSSRCINCGRCNFVCPTCTCFTMQDVFYTDNGKVGERRRVHASCMVDGYTEVAGGGSYRKTNGERMRFKVLHKVYDYKKRNGYHMCVGCGRCDDVCPEYISFSNCVNKLEGAMEEITNHE
ncbi:anaerobic sulfite reductase subunit AsrA [Anaeromicropila herbilytica]|uniref:Anaerobic sulfite reductase subunit A n=1 Tax=Anaeromicropila herbilytica TaxID=2785025 RepID=A0A7R7EM46_9FIRM|nr:anaerobic sulfite reductase subunit AsrA [Anaeromicropila herbilytica]BCN31359.1 anaerobic sulfite reductase subunit A [Anaeromicropila herbilytica]